MKNHRLNEKICSPLNKILDPPLPVCTHHYYYIHFSTLPAVVHCLLYCGVSNNSDGCGTTWNVGLNFSLLMGLSLGLGTYELREFALPKTGRARFHLF